MTADDLRRDLEASRRQMRGDYAALRREVHQELDFAGKTKQAVRSHPLPWLGGAAFLGYLLSPRKKREKVVRPSLPGSQQQMVDATKKAQEPVKKLTLLSIVVTIARMLFPLVRPALTQFAIRQAGTLADRFRR